MKTTTTSILARHFMVATLLLSLSSTAFAVKSSRGLVRSALSGTWQLNTRLSRNGQSELPGKLSSRDRLVEVKTAEDWTHAEADPRIGEFLEATESLEIIFHRRQLTINANGATGVVFTRTMFFDQRTTEPKGLLRAQIVNGQVLTVSRVSRMLVKESYRVDPITGRLFATFIVQNPKSRRPLTVERVYDRSLTAKRCK